MILSLQYCKLHRKEDESAQEWMGRLCIKEGECNYKEHDRRLKEQFINGIDDEEIIKELTAQKYERNRQWAGINMSPKCGNAESTEKGA